MVKMNGVKFKKDYQTSDIDKYLFIKKGITGGISHIAKRHAKANNKYTRDHDPKKPSTFTTYLDMNNFYSWSMSEYLSYSEFKWLKMLMSLI